MDGLEQIRINV